MDKSSIAKKAWKTRKNRERAKKAWKTRNQGANMPKVTQKQKPE